MVAQDAQFEVEGPPRSPISLEVPSRHIAYFVDPREGAAKSPNIV